MQSSTHKHNQVRKMYRFLLVQIVVCLVAVSAAPEDVQETSWDFLVMTDWHGAESYSHNPVFGEPSEDDGMFITHRSYLRDIYDQYGGDLVILPGDTNDGKWYQQEWIDRYYPGLSFQEAVMEGGLNCYGTIRNLFAQSGYDDILVAIGDHELGDNYWGPGHSKTLSLPQYRSSFATAFYMDQTSGIYKYEGKQIGNADPTPYDTEYEYNSFACVHKNVLFVTVDVFVQISNKDFYDRENGLGGEGIVTGDVTSSHLDWFEDVLREARKDATIKHIIVQSHLPILQPVRRVKSSAMFFDRAENSEFWKIMESYEVDVYFAGEVHAFTASMSKTSNSNLVQVVSKSAHLENFLKVTVTGDSLRIDAINDSSRVKNKKKHIYSKKEYATIGSLIIDKSSSAETSIVDSGVLKILDAYNGPLLSFSFDELHSIDDRQIYGFQTRTQLRPSETIMRNRALHKAIHNQGLFGQQFDAHAGNVTINENGGVLGNSGYFDGSTSQMGVWAYGPHGGGGGVISYSVWTQTSEQKEMILIHSGPTWSTDTPKDIFTLTLDNGAPALYASKGSVLRPIDFDNIVLSDGGWHQIVVSMTHRSCLLSEVSLFIDGKRVQTSATEDRNLFFINHSQISVGSLGYSATSEKDFPNWSPFHGNIDEVEVWGKNIKRKDLHVILRKRFATTTGVTCTGKKKEGMKMTNMNNVETTKGCRKACRREISCLGFRMKRTKHNKLKCTLFHNRKPSSRPTKTTTSQIVSCGVAK